jgi:putative ABC transport system permease protein
VTALLAGVLPALLASGPDLVTSLSAGGERAGARRTRTQAGLLVLQVTLSVVLLTGAAVYTRSLVNLRGIDLGFDTDGLALVQLELDGTRSGWGLLSEPEDGPAWPPNEFARVSDLVQERLSELPTVEGAALVHPTPFMFELAMPIEVPGLDSVPRTGAGGPIPIGVSAEYFRVMDLDLVAGRGFDADDDRFGAQPVAVLNETMAGMLWPGEDPLGRCIMPGGADHPCASVVGVVEDAHRQAVIEDDPGMVYYVPVRQQILGGAPEGIFVRTAGADPAAVRAAVLAASPRIRFAHVQSFDEITGYELRPWRLGATMLSGFGILALLVAGVGLYSVFAFDVAGRSRELGLRSALGATRHALLRLVLREVVVLGGTGLALGVGAIVVLRRWIDPVIYETSALDLATLGPVLALLLGVAVVAAALPGRRAATVDPIEALRTE